MDEAPDATAMVDTADASSDPSAGTGPRLPTAAPTISDIEERDRWAKIVTGSVDTVRSSAKTWQTALTASITLVTTGVVIKGPDTAAGLPAVWRVLVTILVGGGIVAAVLGLWLTVTAEAGTRPKSETLQDIGARYLSVSWLAPASSQQAGFLTVTYGKVSACGVAQASPAGELIIAGPDGKETTTIPLTRVTSVTPTAECP
jgi:hypothetical protein